ncbi:MAG TPA: FAD/NAD(P)-binding protein [Candidatus Marinimicrobia bacterium]|nr:FAD/NAD(P)-binding protein [Candidatus Neomarinimicrobiota bacterium]
MSKNPYETTAAVIYEIIEESPTIRTLRLRPEKPMPFLTGQFMEVTVPGIGEGPFTPSSSHYIADTLDFTIMKTGFVTEYIHRTKVGDRLGLRGPYGKGYPLAEFKGKDVLIMGGGVGMAPTRSLFLTLLHDIDDYNSVTFLAGARTPADMIYKDQIAEWRKIPKVTILRSVDKVPEGQSWDEEVCLVTKLLSKISIDPHNNPVIVCGPPVMMKFGTFDLLKYGYPPQNIYLSMEKKMYCGIGQCRHCVMGPYFACKDGPVFTYEQIKDEENIWE